jgi:hypothetical protein
VFSFAPIHIVLRFKARLVLDSQLHSAVVRYAEQRSKYNMRRPRLRRVVDIVLVLATLLATMRIWSATHDPGWGALTRRPIALSSQFDVPGVDWSRSPRTLVMAITTSCPACEAGLSDYKVLATTSLSQAVRLVVVGAERADRLRLWLSAASIHPDYVVSVPDLSQWGITIVPTIMIVNSSGIVTDIVAHRPAPEQLERLRARLTDRMASSPINEPAEPPLISSQELAQRLASPGTLVVDPRSRQNFRRVHRPGAINVPVDELMARASEVVSARSVLVDCARTSSDQCLKAIVTLRSLVSVPVSGMR